MKYSFLSMATAVAISITTFTAASAEAKPAPKLTPGAGMAQLLKQKSSILKKLNAPAGDIALPGSSSLVSGGNNPHLQLTCTYSSTQFPIVVHYDASYLGFSIYNGNYITNPSNTPYNFCHYVGNSACSFLISGIGIPQPLETDFTGNIVQATKRCGTY